MQMTNSPLSVANLNLVKESKKNYVFFSQRVSYNIPHSSKTDVKIVPVWGKGQINFGSIISVSVSFFYLPSNEHIFVYFQCKLHV